MLDRADLDVRKCKVTHRVSSAEQTKKGRDTQLYRLTFPFTKQGKLIIIARRIGTGGPVTFLVRGCFAKAEVVVREDGGNDEEDEIDEDQDKVEEEMQDAWYNFVSRISSSSA